MGAVKGQESTLQVAMVCLDELVPKDCRYLDPHELADRYALDGHQQTLERQTAVLTTLAAAAAG
jgi:hypothetical protein